MSSTSLKASELLAPRCADCREVVEASVPVVNHGDLQFHIGCSPRCNTCGRAMEPGEGGWRSEGRVVWEPWGYTVRLSRLWCEQCLGNATLGEPQAHA